MTTLFVIEDEAHAEPQGEYATRENALAELKKRTNLPWDQEPNRCPCTSWKTCGRRYEIIEYDSSDRPWKELRREAALEISSRGIAWLLK